MIWQSFHYHAMQLYRTWIYQYGRWIRISIMFIMCLFSVKVFPKNEHFTFTMQSDQRKAVCQWLSFSHLQTSSTDNSTIRKWAMTSCWFFVSSLLYKLVHKLIHLAFILVPRSLVLVPMQLWIKGKWYDYAVDTIAPALCRLFTTRIHLIHFEADLSINQKDARRPQLFQYIESFFCLRNKINCRCIRFSIVTWC